MFVLFFVCLLLVLFCCFLLFFSRKLRLFALDNRVPSVVLSFRSEHEDHSVIGKRSQGPTFAGYGLCNYKYNSALLDDVK